MTHILKTLTVCFLLTPLVHGGEENLRTNLMDKTPCTHLVPDYPDLKRSPATRAISRHLSRTFSRGNLSRKKITETVFLTAGSFIFNKKFKKRYCTGYEESSLPPFPYPFVTEHERSDEFKRFRSITSRGIESLKSFARPRGKSLLGFIPQKNKPDQVNRFSFFRLPMTPYFDQKTFFNALGKDPLAERECDLLDRPLPDVFFSIFRHIKKGTEEKIIQRSIKTPLLSRSKILVRTPSQKGGEFPSGDGMIGFYPMSGNLLMVVQEISLPRPSLGTTVEREQSLERISLIEKGRESPTEGFFHPFDYRASDKVLSYLLETLSRKETYLLNSPLARSSYVKKGPQFFNRFEFLWNHILTLSLDVFLAEKTSYKDLVETHKFLHDFLETSYMDDLTKTKALSSFGPQFYKILIHGGFYQEAASVSQEIYKRLPENKKRDFQSKIDLDLIC